MAAGGDVRPLWGVDIDEVACRYASINIPGASFVRADARSVDWHSFQPVDILFASPPCQPFSHLSTEESRSKHDTSIGAVVVSAVAALRPALVFLENVPGYRFHWSFSRIALSLLRMGYSVRVGFVDMDYWGVPQTRKRLILSASHSGAAPLLPARLFDRRQAWGPVVLPFIDHETLRIADLSDWQIDKGADAGATMWVSGQYGRKSDKRCWRGPDEPLMTITASVWKGLPKLVLPSASPPVRFASSMVIALAQTFPKGMILPDRPSDYCRLIGNAVPPAFSENLVRLALSRLHHSPPPLLRHPHEKG